MDKCAPGGAYKGFSLPSNLNDHPLGKLPPSARAAEQRNTTLQAKGLRQ